MKKTWLGRILRITVAIMVTVFLAGLGLSWYVAGALIAPSPHEIGDAPEDFSAASIVITSASGSTIHGWHSKGEAGKGVIVLLHGIRANRLAMLPRARWLDSLGYSTVLIDLQAHGESSGAHITVGYLEQHDVRAAVEFARTEHPNEPIGVIGLSLGGASALLASPLDIDALVLEAVYPDIGDAVHNRVAARIGPFAPVASKVLLLQLGPRLGISPADLRPIEHIADVTCPVFVIGGTADFHTRPEETEALFSRATEPKALWLVDGAAHVDMMNFAPTEYRERVAGFFEQHFGDHGVNLVGE